MIQLSCTVNNEVFEVMVFTIVNLFTRDFTPNYLVLVKFSVTQNFRTLDVLKHETIL